MRMHSATGRLNVALFDLFRDEFFGVSRGGINVGQRFGLGLAGRADPAEAYCHLSSPSPPSASTRANSWRK